MMSDFMLPSWDALHPLVIHFPVALLFVAPLFALAGLLAWKRGRGLQLAALLLMILGTAGAWVAVSTGEAAGELAARTSQIDAVLERHEEMAETVQALFTALTVVYGLLLVLPRLMKREPRRWLVGGVHASFLAVYVVGAVLLARAAHEGGLLVHLHGVHAMMASAPASSLSHEEAKDVDEDEGE